MARLPSSRHAMHRSLWLPDLRASDDSPPQEVVRPRCSRRLSYPTITDPEDLPLRPERHIPNSIATMQTRLIAHSSKHCPDVHVVEPLPHQAENETHDAVRLTRRANHLLGPLAELKLT